MFIYSVITSESCERGQGKTFFQDIPLVKANFLRVLIDLSNTETMQLQRFDHFLSNNLKRFLCASFSSLQMILFIWLVAAGLI